MIDTAFITEAVSALGFVTLLLGGLYAAKCWRI